MFAAHGSLLRHTIGLHGHTSEHCQSKATTSVSAAQVLAARKALAQAQDELAVVGEELAQARREVSLTKREQVGQGQRRRYGVRDWRTG